MQEMLEMIRTGRVVEIREGQVEVCFNRPEACEHCGGCTGQKHKTLVTIREEAPLGSLVDVEMPAKQVFKASLLAYAIPIALLLLGLAVGMMLFKSEGGAALFGILCMALSWGILRLTEKLLQKKHSWQPHIVAIHEEGAMIYGTETDER